MPDIKSQNLNAFYNTGQSQYFIPPYQRTITWPKPQWEALLSDILNLVEEPGKTHLLQMFQLQGTISSNKFAIGDGQQRFVHTSLILIAISYALEDFMNNEKLKFSADEKAMLGATSRRILPDPQSHEQGMLSFSRDNKREARLVVAPTNRKAYNALIMKEVSKLPTNIKDKCIVQHAFEFYCGELKKYLSSGAVFAAWSINNKANELISIIENKLVFGVAYFDSSEEMQASYETTNSRSVPLTESELIKNHIFKHFDPLESQERLVDDYWNYFDSNYWINKDLGDRELYEKVADRTVNREDKLNLLFHYHIIAAMRQNVTAGDKDENKTFKDFKRFYEEKTNTFHHGLPLDKLSKDSRNELSSYYEKVLSQLKDEAVLYHGLEKGTLTQNNPFEIRAKIFHQRVIKACKMPLGYSILFTIMGKDISTDEMDQFLSLIESFAIRKALSKERLNPDALLKMSLPYVSDNDISLKKMRDDLMKNDTKFGSFEGNESIIHFQKSKEWKSSEHSLAMLLIADYENAENHIASGLSPSIPYTGYNLEHFMPQNPVNASISWPIVDEEKHPGERNQITFNLGNFALLPPGINTQLGNRPYQEKKKILRDKANQNNSLGMLSLDYIKNSSKWDRKEVDTYRKHILDAILKKYEGPKQTITRYGCSGLLVAGKLLPDDEIVLLAGGKEIARAKVHPDGSVLYDGKTYANFSTLTRAANPKARGKNYLEAWRKVIGTQYVSLSAL
jgi:uncharacterized protein with ParB-like and HNH nuclease domain